MKMEIDSTVASVLVVVIVLGLGIYTENIKTLALGAMALLILLVALKAVYFEFPVIVALIALTLLALYSDELTDFIGSSTIAVKDEINPNNPKNDEESKFIEEVKKAYEAQYAPAGSVITVDLKYAQDLFRKAGAAEEFIQSWRLDDYPIIFIGGVDTIEKVIIYSDEPLPAEAQVASLIKDRRLWVKVRLDNRDDIWVRVKAFVGKQPNHAYDEYDGAVWDVDIRNFDALPLYEDFSLTIPLIGKGVWICKGSGGLCSYESAYAKKVGEKSHYWSYDIAEV